MGLFKFLKEKFGKKNDDHIEVKQGQVNDFNNEEKLDFSDVTDDSFTVKTKEADPMNGFGYVYFVKKDDNWVIAGYEYK